MSVSDAALWAGFAAFVVIMLALDLGVFHRRAHTVTLREAGLWTAVWVALALAFDIAVYFWRGREAALRFFTAYLIEQTLSVDNMFVFLLVFDSFGVRPEHQHRVLFWGILGALVMRAGFIAAGVGLLERFHWAVYMFGGLLVFTGGRMAFRRGAQARPEDNPLLRAARRLLPVSRDYSGPRFLIRTTGGRLEATPLFLALLVVESTDLVFAVDSIPAVLAVTRDPFIVYTSNVFAVLGLRSLYFLLAGSAARFRGLRVGVAAVLAFVGLKMLLSPVYTVPVGTSLGVILAVLAASVLASLRAGRRG